MNLLLNALRMVGTGFILYIVCYLILEFIEKKIMSFKDLVSRMVVIVILFIPLLRT